MGSRKRRKEEARRTEPARQPEVPATGAGWRAALIVLAGCLVYSNSFAGPFIFDDIGTVVENPHVTAEWNWSRLFAPSPNTALAGRPLVQLTFAVNHALGGLEVAGYHAFNVSVHILCALLVFWIVRRSIELLPAPSRPPVPAADFACAVALLWVVHPLNSEAVSYLTQRTESLMALCFLLTLYASIRGHRSERPAIWLGAAVLSCLAGIACKETIAVAPVAIVLYDRTFVSGSFRAAFRSRPGFYAALGGTWPILAGLVVTHGQSISAGFETATVSPWTYFLNQPAMLIRYLWLTIWPQSLVLYYGWPGPVDMADVWPGLVFVTLLFAAAAVALVKRPVLGFLGAWVFLTLGPSSSVIPIATEVGAERRMYLPLVALLTLAVIGAAAILRGASTGRRTSRAFVGLVAALAIPLALRTYSRNREFSSALTMAGTVIERWPTANAHYMIGTELAAVGDRDRAIVHLREAVHGYPPSRFPLGSELLKAGHAAEAIAVLEAFIRDEPTSLAARSAHGLLANAFADGGRFAAAIPHYRAYLEANPGDADAWNALGIAQVREGLAADAAGSFRGAVNSRPADGRFQMNLARVLLEQGQIDEARALATAASVADPRDPAPHDILGRALLVQGRVEDARRAFARALQIDPSFTPAADALRSLGSK